MHNIKRCLKYYIGAKKLNEPCPVENICMQQIDGRSVDRLIYLYYL